MIPLLNECSITLEAIGEGIMKRNPLTTIGTQFFHVGNTMEQISILLLQIPSQTQPLKSCIQASNYMKTSSEKMKLVGTILQPNIDNPSDTKKTGRSFLKGGS